MSTLVQCPCGHQFHLRFERARRRIRCPVCRRRVAQSGPPPESLLSGRMRGAQLPPRIPAAGAASPPPLPQDSVQTLGLGTFSDDADTCELRYNNTLLWCGIALLNLLVSTVIFGLVRWGSAVPRVGVNVASEILKASKEVPASPPAEPDHGGAEATPVVAGALKEASGTTGCPYDPRSTRVACVDGPGDRREIGSVGRLDRGSWVREQASLPVRDSWRQMPT